MLYNTADVQQAQACVNYLMRLVLKGKAIEVRDATRDMTRSLPQNRYLHAMLAHFAGEYGCTLDEAKWYFKEVNKDIFFVVGEDGGHTFVRSTASLSVEEMSLAIDRFIKWAAEGGIYIPSADDYKAVFAMLQETEKNRPYL